MAQVLLNVIQIWCKVIMAHGVEKTSYSDD